MTKSNHQQRVEQFMTLAQQIIPEIPQIPVKEIRLLRAKLILEEALETIDALGFSVISADGHINVNMQSINFYEKQSVSLEKIADGCADISVVTIGTLSACGIHDEELLQLIDDSNLKKFDVPICPKHLIPMKLAFLKNNEGLYECLYIDCREFAKGPYMRSDGKWIKSSDWKAPDIKKLLMEQSQQRGEYYTTIEKKIKETAQTLINAENEDLPSCVYQQLTDLVKFVEKEFSSI